MKSIITLALLIASSTSFAHSNYLCVGTEPFWSVETTESFLKFNNPVLDESQSLKITETKSALGFAEDFATIFKTRYTRLSIISGNCSDGMSDETYSYHAMFETSDGIFFAGCCNKK